jgi:thymidylate synthase ThyX
MWNDAFKLRLNPHAQLEIRTVFTKIWDLLKEVYPQVFTEQLFNKHSNGGH